MAGGQYWEEPGEPGKLDADSPGGQWTMWWAGVLQGLGSLHSELAVAMLLSDVILRGLEEQCGREFRRGLD